MTSAEQWFPAVPEGWQVTRLGNCFDQVKEPVNEELGIVTVFRDGEVTLRSNRRSEGYTEATDYSQYQVIRPGQLGIHNMDAFAGAIGVSDSHGMCSPVVSVCQPRANVNVRYFAWVLREMSRSGWIEANAKSVRERTSEFRWPMAKIQLVPLPPRAEQDAIVEFLDQELEQIDALIAKNEALVTNLLERRKALIASLVNFGGASSKTVPNNWIPQRLRHLATIESGRDYKEVEVSEGGYPIYGSGGEFGRASRYLYSGESVLLGRKGTIDRPLYVNEAFWTVDTMYWTRFKPGVCIKFMYYWATTIPFKMYSTNTALPSMTGTDLKNMPINLPPLNEQIAIATELDQAIQGMDILQENSEKSVLLLRERRQALISSAVTGKLDLQGAN